MSKSEEIRKDPSQILVEWKIILEKRIVELSMAVERFRNHDKALVNHDQRRIFLSNLSLLKYSQHLYDLMTPPPSTIPDWQGKPMH